MDHSSPDPAERAPPGDDDSADAVEAKAALKEMEEMVETLRKNKNW